MSLAGLRRLAFPAVVVGVAAGLVAAGVLPSADAADVLERVLPVLGFLVAVTVLAELADGAGLFDLAAAGAVRAGRGSVRLLGALVVTLAVGCTVLGSLDTTAVLLTPVVVRLARRLGLNPLPWALTTLWLANTASFLLPVSNLTNLLAAERLQWSAARWALHLWPVAVTAALVTAALAWWLHRDQLRGRYEQAPAAQAPSGRAPSGTAPSGTTPSGPAPSGTAPSGPTGLRADGSHEPDAVLTGAAALACLAFVVAVMAEAPAWAAASGAAVCLGLITALRRPGLLTPRLVPVGMPLATGALFLLVAAADRHGLADLLTRLVDADGTGPLAAVRTAGAAAVSASLVNNLPAYLALEPVAAPLGGGGTGWGMGSGSAVPLLAVLVGVNAGPLLTPWGSLATVLWAARCRAAGLDVPWRRILPASWLLVLLVVPLTAAVLALTAS